MLMEITGWTGSALVIAAYALNSYQKLRSDSPVFYAMNIAGGVFLIIYSVYKDAAPNIFINLVWVAIALPPLIRLMVRKKAPGS